MFVQLFPIMSLAGECPTDQRNSTDVIFERSFVKNVSLGHPLLVHHGPLYNNKTLMAWK